MISLSKAAAAEINRRRSSHPNPNVCFRLGVQPGGCFDFCYSLELDETAHADDQVYTSEGVQIVTDAQSLFYLQGLRLDYSEDLMGGGFRFHNPNATQNCGCGNSFSTSDSASKVLLKARQEKTN